jgi:hypothetical protein
MGTRYNNLPILHIVMGLNPGAWEKSAASCDSPLERGGGVCPLGILHNAPLQPQCQRGPSREGNLIFSDTLNSKPKAINTAMPNKSRWT